MRTKWQMTCCRKATYCLALLLVIIPLIVFVSRRQLEKALPFAISPSATFTSKSSASIETKPGSVEVLSSGQSLSSPNGVYVLTLEPSGDLILRHNAGPSRAIWWTATGDNRTANGHRVLLETTASGDPLLMIQARLLDKQEWTTVWHSDLEPQCQKRELATRRAEKNAISLELSNSGRLRITSVCDLYVPAGDRNANRSLAVIVAGLYRTNADTCNTHMQAIIANHSAFRRVDVFAYMLYEDTDITTHNRSAESIEAAVHDCYGPHLRRVQVVSAAKVEEDFPGGNEAKLQPCGDRLRRLSNQLKTVYDAGNMWRSWAIEHGYLHDTILRIRPDTGFRSDADPPFWSLDDLGSNTLVLPHPRGEHYFYCARMTGRVGVGPTDQIAYGSPAAMGHWLSMFLHLPQIVNLASNPTRPAHRDFSGCEELPLGPRPHECHKPAVCSIECIVAWYLESQGVSFGIEWGWDQGLVRLV